MEQVNGPIDVDRRAAGHQAVLPRCIQYEATMCSVHCVLPFCWCLWPSVFHRSKTDLRLGYRPSLRWPKMLFV